MGFMRNLFETTENDISGQWKILDKEEQLDQIVKDSYQKPVVLFKHSISCGISSMAKYQLEENWDFEDVDFDFYYLDLINYRPISNRIASDFGVIHQSPQIIVLKNGTAVYNTSHHNINISTLKKGLDQ